MDSDRCIGCGVCESICPVGVFRVVNSRCGVTGADRCIGCRNCEASCPVGCITAGEAIET